MRNNLDISQLAYEYLRHSGLSAKNEAEFLIAVQKAEAKFAALLELSSTELLDACKSETEKTAWVYLSDLQTRYIIFNGG